MTAEAKSLTHGDVLDYRKAVQSLKELPKGAKILFSAIASYIDLATGLAKATHLDLATDCGWRDRTAVYRNLQPLTAVGILIVVFEGRYGKPSVYRIGMTESERDDLLTERRDAKKERRAVQRPAARSSSVAKCNTEAAPSQSPLSVAQSCKVATLENDQNCTTVVVQGCTTYFPSSFPYEGLSEKKVELSPREAAQVVTEYGIEVPAKLSDGDRRRGAAEIDRYLNRASVTAGVAVHDAEAALGDELHRMRLRVAIFPGDNIAAFRQISRALEALVVGRHAAG